MSLLLLCLVGLERGVPSAIGGLSELLVVLVVSTQDYWVKEQYADGKDMTNH